MNGPTAADTFTHVTRVQAVLPSLHVRVLRCQLRRPIELSWRVYSLPCYCAPHNVLLLDILTTGSKGIVLHLATLFYLPKKQELSFMLLGYKTPRGELLSKTKTKQCSVVRCRQTTRHIESESQIRQEVLALAGSFTRSCLPAKASTTRRSTVGRQCSSLSSFKTCDVRRTRLNEDT